jgi:hypothetical protein
MIQVGSRNRSLCLTSSVAGARWWILAGAPVTIEYEGFRIPKEEARPRFVESANLIIKSLGSDSFGWDGEFYKIPRMSIRPRREGDAGVAEGCRETAKQCSSFSLYRTKPSNSSCAQSCTSLID